MKLVHVSDIHVHDRPILGSEPVGHLRACLAHIAEHHGDAGRIVVTGDLTHEGRVESYRELRRVLQASPLRGERAPRLLIGNHDEREAFATVFGETPRDENGFIQWSEDVPAGRFVYLDTVRAGSHEGELCDRRRAWLAAQLRRAAEDGVAVFLFMHHNPVTVGVPNADLIGLREPDAFARLLRDHAGVVRHIFFGHCHCTLEGVGFSAPRSTNHPCWPDLGGPSGRMGYGETLERDYNVALIGPSSVVVHTIDFLREAEVKWETTDASGWIAEGAAARQAAR